MPFNMAVAGTGLPLVYNVTIAAPTGPWKRSVNATVDDIGRIIPTNRRITLNITVNSGVVIQANSTSVPAMEIDGLDASAVINLVNLGSICGMGGKGGNGRGLQLPVAGLTGGDSLRVNHNGLTNITNGDGFLLGGGGGGGGGGGTIYTPSGETAVYDGGGGGGGGAGGGAAGTGFNGDHSNGANGSVGTAGASGAGGAGGASTLGAAGGAGGNGGNYGVSGDGGTNGGGLVGNGAAGGPPGRGVVYNLAGTLNWVSGNDSTHIKGGIAGV